MNNLLYLALTRSFDNLKKLLARKAIIPIETMINREEATIESLYNKTTRKVTGALHHYTSYSSAISIIKNRSFRFTRIDLLNDKTETQFAGCDEDEIMYVLSFTNTSKESVAMWMLYGGNIGSGEGKLRLSISRSKLIDSFHNQFYFDKQLNNQIPPSCIENGEGALSKKKFSIRDVVYLDRRKGVIRFSGKSYQERYTENQVKNLFRGFIKYDAWEFESEARVFVILKNGLIDTSAPEHIYAKINEDALRSMEITTNPWIPQDLKSVLRSSLNELAGRNMKHKNSLLEGEVCF